MVDIHGHKHFQIQIIINKGFNMTKKRIFIIAGIAFALLLTGVLLWRLFSENEVEPYLRVWITEEGFLAAETNIDTSAGNFFVIWDTDAGNLTPVNSQNLAQHSSILIGGVSPDPHPVSGLRYFATVPYGAYVQWDRLDMDGHIYSCNSTCIFSARLYGG